MQHEPQIKAQSSHFNCIWIGVGGCVWGGSMYVWVYSWGVSFFCIERLLMCVHEIICVCLCIYIKHPCTRAGGGGCRSVSKSEPGTHLYLCRDTLGFYFAHIFLPELLQTFHTPPPSALPSNPFVADHRCFSPTAGACCCVSHFTDAVLLRQFSKYETFSFRKTQLNNHQVWSLKFLQTR